MIIDQLLLTITARWKRPTRNLGTSGKETHLAGYEANDAILGPVSILLEKHDEVHGPKMRGVWFVSSTYCRKISVSICFFALRLSQSKLQPDRCGSPRQWSRQWQRHKLNLVLGALFFILIFVVGGRILANDIADRSVVGTDDTSQLVSIASIDAVLFALKLFKFDFGVMKRVRVQKTGSTPVRLREQAGGYHRCQQCSDDTKRSNDTIQLCPNGIAIVSSAALCKHFSSLLCSVDVSLSMVICQMDCTGSYSSH